MLFFTPTRFGWVAASTAGVFMAGASLLHVAAAHADSAHPGPAEARPTPEQMHILHQMDPALHAGQGHPHGPPPGAHDCPHDCGTCQPSANGTVPGQGESPPGHSNGPQAATVNGTLQIKTAEGTHTLTITDVAHNTSGPCMWPTGGSIRLTSADNSSHTAVFAATCGSVQLDGATLNLPTHHEFGRHGGKMGAAPQAKDAKK